MRWIGLFLDRSTSVRDAAWFKIVQILLIFKEMIKYFLRWMRKESWLKNVEGMYNIWSLFLYVWELSFATRAGLPLAIRRFANWMSTSRVGDHSETPYTSKRLLMVEKNKKNKPLTVKANWWVFTGKKTLISMINQRNTWNYKKRDSEDENIPEKLTFVEDFYWFSMQHSCFLLRFNGKFCIIHNVLLGPPV